MRTEAAFELERLVIGDVDAGFLDSSSVCIAGGACARPRGGPARLAARRHRRAPARGPALGSRRDPLDHGPPRLPGSRPEQDDNWERSPGRDYVVTRCRGGHPLLVGDQPLVTSAYPSSPPRRAGCCACGSGGSGSRTPPSGRPRHRGQCDGELRVGLQLVRSPTSAGPRTTKRTRTSSVAGSMVVYSVSWESGILGQPAGDRLVVLGERDLDVSGVLLLEVDSDEPQRRISPFCMAIWEASASCRATSGSAATAADVANKTTTAGNHIGTCGGMPNHSSRSSGRTPTAREGAHPRGQDSAGYFSTTWTALASSTWICNFPWYSLQRPLHPDRLPLEHVVVSPSADGAAIAFSFTTTVILVTQKSLFGTRHAAACVFRRVPGGHGELHRHRVPLRPLQPPAGLMTPSGSFAAGFESVASPFRPPFAAGCSLLRGTRT